MLGDKSTGMDRSKVQQGGGITVNVSSLLIVFETSFSTNLQGDSNPTYEVPTEPHRPSVSQSQSENSLHVSREKVSSAI